MTSKNESNTTSPILDAVYEAAKGLHEAGAMDELTLCEFERLCLSAKTLEAGKEAPIDDHDG